MQGTHERCVEQQPTQAPGGGVRELFRPARQGETKALPTVWSDWRLPGGQQEADAASTSSPSRQARRPGGVATAFADTGKAAAPATTSSAPRRTERGDPEKAATFGSPPFLCRNWESGRLGNDRLLSARGWVGVKTKSWVWCGRADFAWCG